MPCRWRAEENLMCVRVSRPVNGLVFGIVWRRTYVRTRRIHGNVTLYVYPNISHLERITTADIITHTIIMLCHLFGNKRHHHDGAAALVLKSFVFAWGDYDFGVRDFFNCVWTPCRAFLECNTVLCTNEASNMRHDILSGKQVICTMRALHA